MAIKNKASAYATITAPTVGAPSKEDLARLSAGRSDPDMAWRLGYNSALWGDAMYGADAVSLAKSEDGRFNPLQNTIEQGIYHIGKDPSNAERMADAWEYYQKEGGTASYDQFQTFSQAIQSGSNLGAYATKDEAAILSAWAEGNSDGVNGLASMAGHMGGAIVGAATPIVETVIGATDVITTTVNQGLEAARPGMVAVADAVTLGSDVTGFLQDLGESLMDNVGEPVSSAVVDATGSTLETINTVMDAGQEVASGVDGLIEGISIPDIGVPGAGGGSRGSSFLTRGNIVVPTVQRQDKGYLSRRHYTGQSAAVSNKTLLGGI